MENTVTDAMGVKISVDDMPSVVRESVVGLIEVEKKVNYALKKANEAKESALNNSSQKVRLVFGHKKNIESINEALCDVADATGELADAQTIILDYMRKLSEVTKFLFQLGVSNIAANRAVVRELEKQLSSAKQGELSPYARQELLATIAQLKSQQDFMDKQDKTYAEVKKLGADAARDRTQINEKITSLVKAGKDQNAAMRSISETLEFHDKSIAELSEYNDKQDDCINFLYRNGQTMNSSIRNIVSQINIISKFNSEQEKYIDLLYSYKLKHDNKIEQIEKREPDIEFCKKTVTLLYDKINKQNVTINNLNSEIEQQKKKINELHKIISDMKMYNDRQDELINALCEKAGFKRI